MKFALNEAITRVAMRSVLLVVASLSILAVIAGCWRRAMRQRMPARLDRVLTQMDTAAASFRTTEASFAWDQYQKVMDETETQKGQIYFRRQDKETQMMADITEPDQQSALFSGGKVQVYQPKIDQVTEYNPGKKSQRLRKLSRARIRRQRAGSAEALRREIPGRRERVLAQIAPNWN